jgi:hypothetical protein
LDFWDLTVLIFRRWKIALPLLLLSIGATLFVAFTAKPDYTMTSYVQFIPAKVAPSDNPTAATLRNPWNSLGLNTLGQASIYATQDQGFLDSLKASHHTDNFTLTMTYPDPIVTVEVVGKTRDDARETTELIVSRLRGAAESLQRGSGVADADIIASQRLDRGQNLVPSNSKVKRAVAAVAAAGLIVTAGGAVGFDAILRRRARKRADAEAVASGDGPPAPEKAVAGVNGANGVTPARAGVGVNGVNGLNGDQADAALRAAPPESLERTAIIIKRSSSVVKPAPPKQRRSPAATYRSANAQSAEAEAEAGEEAEKPAETTPEETNGDTPADVQAVLQPKWVGSENGSKSK